MFAGRVLHRQLHGLPLVVEHRLALAKRLPIVSIVIIVCMSY